MATPLDRKQVAAWIARMMGDRTGQQFADDITATTGWKVDRSRISKYANASIPIGRDVVSHMSEYAEKKGLPPLDLTPEPEPVDLATAVMTLATVVEGMRAEQAAWRRGIVAALEASEGPARQALLAALVPRPLEPSQQ